MSRPRESRRHPEIDTETSDNAPIPPKNLSFCTFFRSKVLCIAVTLLIIGAAIYFAEFLLSRAPQQVQDFFMEGDQWQGVDIRDMPKWNTQGSGVLQLEMLNALEDPWQPFYEQTLLEWNSGTPHVLELTSTKVDRAVDGSCEFVRGKFIVCNGDYGDTQFHGVNEVLAKDGTILASAAKMNDFYMAQSTEARQQYTICHEIGHGLGLPHSDENFFNLNQGNCMDYTARPWSNMSPDSQTFSFLNEIYGIPESSTTSTTTTSTSTSSNGDGNGDGDSNNNSNNDNNNNNNNNINRNDYAEEEEVKEDDDDEKDRHLRRHLGEDGDKEDSSSDNADFDGQVPDDIVVRAHKASASLRSNLADYQSSLEWVQLHRNNGTAAFRIDLGDGFHLQAHFLLVVPEEE